MLITSQSTENFAKKEGGGKCYNLYLLSKEGFPVPDWVGIGASVFKLFVEQTELHKKIETALTTLQKNSSQQAILNTADQIRNWILATPLPREVEEKIRAAYQKLNRPFIAVRSSALDEDSAQNSFAGQLSTYLFVDSENKAIESLKECWASGFSDRGLSYRLQKNISLTHPIRVGVIFQEMLDSEKSGVLFTCDPISQDGSKVTINSVYGVGEGLVSGLLDADTFVLEKKTGQIVQKEIAIKATQLVQSKAATGTEEISVPPELQNQDSLSLSELKQLVHIGKKIESFYGYPQDVEWGWKDEQFYLLQARPVTTSIKNNDGFLYIWDNSNIVESYGGITKPLTFSFAHHVYHWVYIQFCEILLIPHREIRKMDFFLRNMLGIFHGRIYYNILNWYKLTSILPGFKYNRSFMETMMGTSHSLSDEIADRIKPPGFQEKFSSKIRRLITGLKFLYFHFTIQSMVDRFLKYFHETYDQYRHRNYSRTPADQIYSDYQELEQKLLMEWKAPIINDFLCMVHFGILKKLTSKWLSHLGPSIQNDLLCGEGNLESAEPTRELIRMADIITKNAELKALIEKTPAPDCYEVIKNSKFKDFTGRVEKYIDLYGFRCMNEMKLEEKDLYQDPTFLFTCLINYLRSGKTDLSEYEKREKEIRHEAEKKVSKNLSGFKKIVYLWSLKHARKAVKNRENTRFCRTRIYGIARAMFNGIGQDFSTRGIIDHPEDIFYLMMSEMTGALEGTLPAFGLKNLIELRKNEYKGFETLKPGAGEPDSRFMTRGPVYWMNDHFLPEEKQTIDEKLPKNCLKGTGCCPGTIEGTIKVILSPQDDMQLNGEILVTVRTDPGWIPLYPSISGLLVERGGLLSHSAIVAREMGLPTVVGIKGLTQRLKSGMKVRLNGESGLIEILE